MKAIKIPVKIYSVTVLLHHRPRDDGVKFVTEETNGSAITVYCALGEGESMYSHFFLQCLTHELNHAAMCILGQSGISFDHDNQEALCYLQDFLLKNALDKIAKRIKG